MTSNKEDSLKLRPHHALCIRFFRGKGYSKDFTDNMIKTIQRLNNGEEFTFATGMDTLCFRCPNNISGTCTSEKKVQHYDRKVSELLDLKEGSLLDYQTLYQKISSAIMDKGLFDSICKDCSWQELCHDK